MDSSYPNLRGNLLYSIPRVVLLLPSAHLGATTAQLRPARIAYTIAFRLCAWIRTTSCYRRTRLHSRVTLHHNFRQRGHHPSKKLKAYELNSIFSGVKGLRQSR